MDPGLTAALAAGLGQYVGGLVPLGQLAAEGRGHGGDPALGRSIIALGVRLGAAA